MKNCFDFNYNNSILSLSNSLLKYYGIKPFHPTLKILDERLDKQKHKNILFLILDGLGTDIINRHLSQESFISSHIISPIYTVFPPTTTAATITLHSARSPFESGWLGWTSYYKEHNRIIENFLNTDFYTGEHLSSPSPVDDILSYKTIYSHIIEQNPDVEYHRVFPPFDKNGVKSFPEMCSRISQIIKEGSGKKIISTYWNDPDHTIHYHGVNSEEAQGVIKEINTELEQLYKEISDTFIIITADHGLVDVETVWINDYPEICEMMLYPLSLEARYVTFFIKEEFKNKFAEKFNQTFANDFKLFTKEEFLSSGLLGPGQMHKKVNDFIGDFVAISLGKKELRQTTYQREQKVFVADHAGISEAEMKVPLIIAEKE